MVKPEGLSGNGSTDQGTGSKDDFEGEGRRGTEAAISAIALPCDNEEHPRLAKGIASRRELKPPLSRPSCCSQATLAPYRARWWLRRAISLKKTKDRMVMRSSTMMIR